MQAAEEELERKLGYQFQNRQLLRRALTHRSWLSERGSPTTENADNEQLEFLGDSVLGFVVSEWLVLRHEREREGQLSQWKAQLVSSAHLYRCALDLDLGPYLWLGKGEERNGGRERKALLANALEAIIGAILLDAGIEAARRFIEEHVLGVVGDAETIDSTGLLNHKGLLHARAQELGLPVPQYVTIESSGPDHAKVFTVEARVGDQLVSRAQGTSKKAASQHAAEDLIARLDLVKSGLDQSS